MAVWDLRSSPRSPSSKQLHRNTWKSGCHPPDTRVFFLVPGAISPSSFSMKALPLYLSGTLLPILLTTLLQYWVFSTREVGIPIKSALFPELHNQKVRAHAYLGSMDPALFCFFGENCDQAQQSLFLQTAWSKLKNQPPFRKSLSICNVMAGQRPEGLHF